MKKRINILNKTIVTILTIHILLLGLFHAHDIDGCHVPVSHFFHPPTECQIPHHCHDHAQESDTHDGCHHTFCLCDEQLFFERPNNALNLVDHNKDSDIIIDDHIVTPYFQPICNHQTDTNSSFITQHIQSAASKRAPPHSI